MSLRIDWSDIDEVFAKVKEEVEEIADELNKEQVDNALLAEEIGDLLFATVNLARHAKLDAEQVLRQANSKFSKRFNFIEQHFVDNQLDIQQATLEQLELLWQQAKQCQGE